MPNWTHRRLGTSIRLAGKSKAFSRCSSRTSRSKRSSAPAKALSGFKFGQRLHYFADKVSEVFIEGQVAFLHAGDISEVESFCLSGFTALVEPTIHKTAKAGFISTRVRSLGQQIYSKGALLLRIGVKQMKMRGRNRKITPF